MSASLQRKLPDRQLRQLRQPLESCLVAEDGVTSLTLVGAIQALLEGDSALVPLLRPHAALLVREATHLPLQPVASLLLTAAQTARPQTYAHALAAMALNGALMTGHGGATPEFRLDMLCGLLHDIGEMYIDPLHVELEADRELHFTSYQQLVVHPHVGQLLLTQLTNYRSTVSRAVAEHHERLDGSGYPHARHADRLSPQGRLLAVTEGVLVALRNPFDHLLHASVARRAVPGEFDLHWVGQVSQAACAQPPRQAVMEADDIQARLTSLGEVLGKAEGRVAQALGKATLPKVQSGLSLVTFLLSRLRTGWNESGLWNPEALGSADAAEVEALEDELYFRLRGVQRATLLLAGELPTREAAELVELCDSLAMG